MPPPQMDHPAQYLGLDGAGGALGDPNRLTEVADVV